MKKTPRQAGIGTLVTHLGEFEDPNAAHVMPIYETSAFVFPDVATGQAIFKDNSKGFYYTRIGNPNIQHLARKIAALEGLDLIRKNPDSTLESLVAGEVFTSGMAAVTAGLLACLRYGDVVIAQESLYSGTFVWLNQLAPKLGIKVVWVHDSSPKGWDVAFDQNPNAKLAFTETPANPTMDIVDLAALAEIAHRHKAILMVDNTVATPYCQRPLTLGADVIIHSTTKYLSGHGAVVGGALVSSQPEFVHREVHATLTTLGGSPSPFDCWLTNIGLKTLELRMARHCENALAVARYLEQHKKVARVNYPGLASHPSHEIAKKQMSNFGGMMSFELKGGYDAGVSLMEHVQIATLAVSLGNVDTLIQHPASMTHHNVPAEDRRKVGITDGLTRLSVGIENVDDIISDLEQALNH